MLDSTPFESQMNHTRTSRARQFALENCFTWRPHELLAIPTSPIYTFQSSINTHRFSHLLCCHRTCANILWNDWAHGSHTNMPKRTKPLKFKNLTVWMSFQYCWVRNEYALTLHQWSTPQINVVSAAPVQTWGAKLWLYERLGWMPSFCRLLCPPSLLLTSNVLRNNAPLFATSPQFNPSYLPNVSH